MKPFFQLSIFLACMGTVLISAQSETFIGVDGLAGIGASGGDLEGALDLGKDKQWNVSLTLATQKTTIGTPSNTKQGALALSDQWGPALTPHVGLTSWKDTVNDIHYIGPTVGFTWLWLREASTKENPHAVAGTGVATENPFDVRPPTSGDDEILGITFDTDIFVYGTDVVGSNVRSVYVPRLGRYVDRVVTSTTTLHDTQVHPSLTVERPLWDSAVTPYVTLGHSFYSTDPAAIAAISGQPRFASSAGRLGSLASGFFTNNGVVGAMLALPAQITFTPAIGADESAIDHHWAISQSLNLTALVMDHWRLKGEWDRTLQSGTSLDTFMLGTAWIF